MDFFLGVFTFPSCLLPLPTSSYRNPQLLLLFHYAFSLKKFQSASNMRQGQYEGTWRSRSNCKRSDITHGCTLTVSIPGEIEVGNSQGLTISNSLALHIPASIISQPPLLSHWPFTLQCKTFPCDVEHEKQKVEDSQTFSIAVWQPD